jgi:hypothetical protein
MNTLLLTWYLNGAFPFKKYLNLRFANQQVMLLKDNFVMKNNTSEIVELGEYQLRTKENIS